MDIKDVKLPESEKAIFRTEALLRNEWVTDPPPWIISRLRDDIIIDIYKIKMRGLAELAEIEKQIKEIESRMFSDIEKSLGQMK